MHNLVLVPVATSHVCAVLLRSITMRDGMLRQMMCRLRRTRSQQWHEVSRSEQAVPGHLSTSQGRRAAPRIGTDIGKQR
jgi:hypothetical protein